MSLFPVTCSLLSKQAVGLHIQHHYEIGSVVKIQYFLRGMNDTYEVETDVDRYIFQVYRADRRSRSDIEFELELLRFLGANGISVSEPIPRKDGTYLNGFNVTEGMRYGVLFQYAEGHERPIHAAADSYRFGKSISHMHKAADHFECRQAREQLDMECLIDRPLAFLRGYGSVRSLSENDLAAVPVFVAIRQLWLFGLCFQDSEFAGIADFDEGFIDSKSSISRAWVMSRTEENI